jgi:hypothetical protein
LSSTLANGEDGTKKIDLMNVGAKLQLFEGMLPSGTYKGFRIVSPMVNKENRYAYVVLEDGSEVNVKIPSGQSSGFKMNVDKRFTITPTQTVELNIKFDPKKSIVKLGNGRYILKPTTELDVIIKSVTSAASSGAVGSL